MGPSRESGMKISQPGNSASKGKTHLDMVLKNTLTDVCHRLVENPIVLDFRQILQEFDQITAPVTLVCAGNRRKEQNQVRKSKGFSWGAAGLSTALFTGPMMRDVIKRAKPMRRAKYVCMEGADKLVRYDLFQSHGFYANFFHSQTDITEHPSSSTGSWIPIEASCSPTK